MSMEKRRDAIPVRLLSALLTLSIAWPSPACATPAPRTETLRPTIENKVEAGLEEALGAPPAAGLEEGERIDLLEDEATLRRRPALPRHTGLQLTPVGETRIPPKHAKEMMRRLEGASVQIHTGDTGTIQVQGEGAGPIDASCSPCVFMIVHDTRSRRTHYAHSFGWSFKNLELVLGNAAEEFSGLRGRVVFYFGGGGIPVEEIEDIRHAENQLGAIKSMLADRQALIKRAEAEKFRIVQAFPIFVDTAVSTLFDPKTGLLIVEEWKVPGTSHSMKAEKYMDSLQGYSGEGGDTPAGLEENPVHAALRRLEMVEEQMSGELAKLGLREGEPVARSTIGHWATGRHAAPPEALELLPKLYQALAPEVIARFHRRLGDELIDGLAARGVGRDAAEILEKVGRLESGSGTVAELTEVLDLLPEVYNDRAPEILRREREQLGISLRKFGEALAELGYNGGIPVHPSTVSYWENKDRLRPVPGEAMDLLPQVPQTRAARGPAAGLEEGEPLTLEIPEHGFWVDGLTVQGTGRYVGDDLAIYMRSAESALVVPVGNRPMVRQIFRHPGIRELQASLSDAGILVRDLPEDPAAAQEILRREAKAGDVILLAPGTEVPDWVPADSRVPVLVMPAHVAAGLTASEMAALAAVARAHGGILHIGEISRPAWEEPILVLHSAA